MERLLKPIKLLGILILFTAFVFASGTVTLAAPLTVQRTAAAALPARQVEPDAAFRTENHISSITYSKSVRQRQGDDILQQIDAIMPTAEELELPQPPFVLKESVSGISTLQQYIDVFQNQGMDDKVEAIRQAKTKYHFAGEVRREWNTWGETWEADTPCPDTVYMVLGSGVLVFGSEDEAVGLVADEDLRQVWTGAFNNQSVDILEASPVVFTMRRTFDTGCGALTQYLKMGHVGSFVVVTDLTAYAGIREEDMWSKVDRVHGIVMQKLIAQVAINHCLQTPGVLNAFNVFAQSFVGSPTIVDSGGSYWIQMSTGYEEGGEAEEARADQPNISLSVTMNGVELPMTGPTRVEYIDRAGFWAVNSYHCTGPLAPGSYNIVGTSYRSGEVIDSVSFVLLAQPVAPSSGNDILQQISVVMPTAGELELSELVSVPAVDWPGTMEEIRDGLKNSPGYEKAGDARQQAATDYHFQGAVYRSWSIPWEPGEECPNPAFVGIYVHVFGSEAETVAFLADEDLLLAWESADKYPSYELDTSTPGVLTVRQTYGDSECGTSRAYCRWIAVGRFAIDTCVGTSDTNEAEVWGIVDHSNQVVAQKLAGAGIE